MKISALSYLLFTIIFLTGGILGYVHGKPDVHNLQVVITLESSTPAEMQLFYDTGRGFNENESASKVVYQENVPVTLHYDFAVPNLIGLRFDPSRSPARIKIHEIMLKYQGEKPFSVPLDSLTAVNDIKTLYLDGRILIVETTEAARDPILYLSRIGPVPHPSMTRAILFILAGAFIALGVAFFILWVYRNSLNLKESLGRLGGQI